MGAGGHTTYAQGQETLAISAYSPGDAVLTSLGSWTLASPSPQGHELFTNLLAERIACQVSTGAAGSWFSITKLLRWAKPDPYAFVCGTE